MRIIVLVDNNGIWGLEFQFSVPFKDVCFSNYLRLDVSTAIEKGKSILQIN